MSEKNSHTESFAYILIVENDEELRQRALHTIAAPKCAVDVARDEDEAVYKALQHRPRLIIVRRHEPIEIDPLNPPRFSVASQICRRARLSRSLRLVTHSDVWVMGPATKVYLKDRHCKLVNHPDITVPGRHCIANYDTEESLVILEPTFFLLRPLFKDQDWRKEWFLYCSRENTIEVLSQLIPFWLGRTSNPLKSTTARGGISFSLRNKHRSDDGYTVRYLSV